MRVLGENIVCIFVYSEFIESVSTAYVIYLVYYIIVHVLYLCIFILHAYTESIRNVCA